MKQEELIKIYLQFIKIAICMMFVFSAMVLVSQVRAEDNKTTDVPKFTGGGFPIILDDNRWPSQLLYDTIGACYQGTIRWIIISNPSLLGQAPGPMAQRQMVEHCFCVMDKVRKEHTIEVYKKKVFDSEWTGNLFMTKALECVAEYKTLPTFFATAPTPDNKTKTDNETTNPAEVPDGETEDSLDEQQEESEGSPETLFQG
tara:strand:+ start:25 stop:627 length:603 start_codon:yes stop_codon:yes gene_type:complete